MAKKTKDETSSQVFLTVAGFKSIRDETKVELRPLTILAGANSSGKSSLIQPLLLIKQTLEASYDPGPLMLDGPNVHFTAMNQLLWKRPGETPKIKFTTALERGDRSTAVTFRKTGHGPELDNVRYVQPPIFPPKKHDVRIDPIELSLTSTTTIAELRSRNIVCNYTGKKEPADSALVVQRKRSFLSLDPYWIISTRGPDGDPGFLFPDLQDPMKEITSHIIHLPGLRNQPLRTYQKAAPGPLYPGLFTDYVAGIVSSWKRTKDTKLLTSA